MSPIRYEVNFTGQAETYRPIWRKNMLLLLLTAGFALPWALTGSLRYFYRHTEVAGGRFDYHANPWQMFAGNVVGTVVLNAIYYGISLTGPYKTWGVAGMQLLTAALLPLWLHGFLDFQLQHTSWNGRRLRLAATPMDAFRAMWGPTALYTVGGSAAVGAVWLAMDGRLALAALTGLVALACLCFALPWLYVQYKLYQHRHAALGAWRHEGEGLPMQREAWGVSARTAAMAMAVVLLVVVPVCWALASWAGLDWAVLARLKEASQTGTSGHVALVAIPGFLLFFVLMMAGPYAYLSTRLQHSLWPLTQGGALQFESRVVPAHLVRVSLRNWLRVVCTLGWTYPDLAVGEARLRLQAMSVWATPEALAALMADGPQPGVAGASQEPDPATVASPQ